MERRANSDDRLVLVTSSTSSIAIKESLPKVLAKIRDLSGHNDLNALITKLPISERNILETFRKHLATAWNNSINLKLTESKELQLLKLIWIEILDLDEGASGEREAKNLLQTAILENTAQSETAWNLLIQGCANLATRRSGSNRTLLQQHLINSGIRIKAQRSIQNDIEKLCLQSKQTLSLLRELSVIRVGHTRVKIRRPSTQALYEAAEKNSIVVVGEPGAGKSGALHDLVEMLIQQNRDVFFFAVDRLEAKSINSLKNELDIEHEIIEIIRNWSDDRPAFLVIDALDAARSESAAQTFYDLIYLTLNESKRWRVIASIRKFDLRHNIKLRRLFAGNPRTEFRVGEFHDVCHFNTPLLNVEEWSQIKVQSSELSRLIEEVEDPLLSLLKVPFNLRIAGELIGGGLSVESITSIKTQIELLDCFWEERVIRSDYDGDARQAVLLKVVQIMISNRAFHANRISICAESNKSRNLNQLLSSYILSERELPSGNIETNVITFAHHVLFDYATSRLLFRGETNNLVQTLEEDQDLVLAIRPSIVMHFQHLWITDSTHFWQTYFQVIMSKQIPEIAKLIGASVIVEFPVNVENFSSLINTLSSKDIRQREVPERAFRHITGALLVIAISSSISKLVGNEAPPWCEILDSCTATLRLDLAHSIRPVLWTICEKPYLLTDKQRHHAGRIARRLLSFALTLDPHDPILLFTGIDTVCKTFESNALDSANLIRQCLTPDHVLAYGYEELFRFAQEVECLMPLDPQLVEEMYLAAFTNYDNSAEKTYALASQILPLTSTRRQDFDMARFSFAQKYNKFLNIAPLNALQVLIVTVNAYIDTRNEDRYGMTEKFTQDASQKRPLDIEKFFFDDRQAAIRPDYSGIWGEGFRSQNEYSLQILDDFERYLEQLSSRELHTGLRRKILAILTNDACNAVFWRLLIKVGTKYPKTLGNEIRSLTWAYPILTLYDTTIVIGNFLTAIFSNLNEEERVRVEQTILNIPKLANKEARESAKGTRNRLLGCLIKEALVLDETKQLFNQLEAERNLPPNEPAFKSSFYSEEYTDEHYLKEQGVSLEDEKSYRIFELTQAVKNFAAKHQNTAPTIEEFTSSIVDLQALYQSITTAESESIHKSQVNMAWGYLADACASLVKVENWSCEMEGASFIKNTLLECSSYPDPQPNPDHNKTFDEHPSWGPAARIDAAEGLILLATHESCIDNNVIAQINKLGLHDEVPAVRFQIAIHLTSLYYSAPDLMWFLFDAMSSKEQSIGILKFLVNGPLNSLARYHPDKITELTKLIYDRIQNNTESKELKKNCTSIFLGLYLWQNQEVCKEQVNTIINDTSAYNVEAHQIAFVLREYLNLGLDDLTNKEKERIRINAFSIIERILLSTAEAIGLLENNNENLPSFNSWTEKDQEKWRNLAHLAESVGNQIYFASGAYEDNDGKIAMETEARQIFLIKAKNILNLLADFGYASLTHHLLKTLVFFAAYDPKDVFLIIGKVVRRGKSSGYQYESMAADLVVKVVQQFIAEFRYIFQEHEECRRTLIEILDTFVEAGWANARRLTYGVEDIFR